MVVADLAFRATTVNSSSNVTVLDGNLTIRYVFTCRIAAIKITKFTDRFTDRRRIMTAFAEIIIIKYFFSSKSEIPNA